jgi:hypothetical protein
MNQLKIETMFLEQPFLLRHPDTTHDPADGAPVEPNFLLGAGGCCRREKEKSEYPDLNYHCGKRKDDPPVAATSKKISETLNFNP